MKTLKNQKKSIIIFFSAIILTIILTIILSIFLSILRYHNYHKLVCTSSKGNITLYYSNAKVKKYTTYKMEYDIKNQNKYINKVGIDKYIDEFELWFENNSNGKCKKVNKN